MAAPNLKLVAGEPSDRTAGRGGTLAIFAWIAGCATLATALGADLARRPFDPRETADEAMRLALVRSNDDPEVRARLRDLRATLGRRPLDSMTRSAYASLLLSMSRGRHDVAAAVSHAERAVELAPVTLPVVRSAVLVLAYTDRAKRAAALVKSAFGYDPEAAASLLWRIEPLLGRLPIAAAVPEDPEAWLAWSVRLDLADRHDEADSWLDRGCRRFPEHLGLVDRAAVRALQSGRWERLAELLPPDREIPDERAAAGLFAHRALLHAHRGEADDARADADHALRLAPDDRSLRLAAGEAYLGAGDLAAARRLWSALAFELEASRTDERRVVLKQLARLEDEHGTPAAALRAWRALTEVDPEDPEARRRIDDLTGFDRSGT